MADEAVIFLASYDEIRDWLDFTENRPRGFAPTYHGLQVLGYRWDDEKTWRTIV